VIYSATMEFLADEGFLTYTDKAGGEAGRHFAEVRLTSKGLAVLSATPAAIKAPGPSLGDQAGAGTKEAVRAAVRMATAAVQLGG
jgi:hypothetical protein